MARRGVAWSGGLKSRSSSSSAIMLAAWTLWLLRIQPVAVGLERPPLLPTPRHAAPRHATPSNMLHQFNIASSSSEENILQIHMIPGHVTVVGMKFSLTSTSCCYLYYWTKQVGPRPAKLAGKQVTDEYRTRLGNTTELIFLKRRAQITSSMLALTIICLRLSIVDFACIFPCVLAP